MATTVLWFIDTEWIIPSQAHKLARRHDDPLGERTYGVWFLNDRDGNLLSAQQFLPTAKHLKRLLIMLRDETGAVQGVIEAERATWEPQKGHPAGGLWKLERGIRRSRQQRATAAIGPREEEAVTYVDYYDSELSPRDIQMRQSSQWLRYLSSRQLSQLSGLGLPDVAQTAQIKHERLATPVVNVLLLLLGLPFLLRRLPGNLLEDAAKCMGICGLCFVVSIVGQNLSPTSLPALPSWIPIIIFAPLAVVLLDRIKT
jgi:lipopolysaccharide export LptBFGC system permease protein LptF